MCVAESPSSGMGWGLHPMQILVIVFACSSDRKYNTLKKGQILATYISDKKQNKDGSTESVRGYEPLFHA